MKNYFLIALCIALSGVSYAQGGQLDPSFGENGIATLNVGLSTSFGRSVAVQPDGKIVTSGLMIGEDGNTIVSRLLPDGTYDPAFGVGGQVIVDINPYSNVDSEFPIGMALQPDGKIIVVGAVSMDYDYLYDIMVLRLNPNGDMDPSFSGDGKIIMDLGSDFDALYSVAVQQDGKIIAAGGSGYPEEQIFLIRFNPNGVVDYLFGTNGMVFQDIVPGESDSAFDIFLQEDNKILVGGYAGDGRMALLRYLPDGTPDVSFGFQGLAAPDFDESIDQINKIAISPDGRIFTAGASLLLNSYPNYNININLACFLPDGQPDFSFGAEGCLIMDIGGVYEVATGIEIVENNKVMVGGLTDGSFFAARFDMDGTLDAGFGEGGIQITTLPCFAPYNYDEGADDMDVQPDGKVVLTGTSSSSITTLRYSTNGSLDPSFGENGIVQLDLPGQVSIDEAKDMAIQSDGRIILAGNARIYEYDTEGEVVVTRLLPDGTPDQTFGKNGMVTTDFLSTVNAVIVQQDNKIVVAVQPAYYSEYEDAEFVLIRYMPDGTLDNTFGTSGIFILDLPYYNSSTGAKSIIGLPDGKMVVSCSVTEGFIAARLHQSGSLDSTFGVNGVAIFYMPNNLYGSLQTMARQQDGKLLLGGGDKDLLLFRCNADGIPDVFFGNYGLVSKDFGSPYDEYIQDIAVQNDGKILVAGYDINYPARIMIGRYLPNGNVDEDFGSDGWVIMNAYYSSNPIQVRVDIQQDGKILLSGKKSFSSIFLTRLLYNGQPDVSFGINGSVTLSETPHGYGDKNVWALHLQPDNKIVIAGFSEEFTTDHDFLVARFLPGTVISTQEPAGPIETLAIHGGPASRFAFLVFRLSESANLTVEIHNMNGQCVQTPVQGSAYSAGEHRILLNLADLTPGPYFVTLSGDSGRRTVKMIR